MGTLLRMLIVEDSQDDAELLVRELGRGGYSVNSQRVDSPAALQAALDAQIWDLIICDYSMPHFSGLDALHLVRSRLQDIPFIFLSGNIGEETAVAALKQGAQDYVMKNNIKRLLPAIQRELEDYARRKERAQLEAKIQKHSLQLEMANQELKDSEEKYRLLFDGNPMPTWVFDRHTLKFLAVNEAAIRHYGYSRKEFLTMTIADIRPKEGLPKLMDAVSKSVPGLSEAEVWRHQKKDRTLIDVEITSHPICFAGKDAELILSQDVTEQRKAHEKVRQSEERFAKAFRSSPLPITISTEKEGRYVDANQAFLKMMGYHREELLNWTADDLRVWVNPMDRKVMLEQLDRPIPTEPMETRFRTKSGKERLVQVSADRLILDGIPCVLANTLDVTESRRLEAQFRQAQKMEAVGRLAGGVAHDFNNLLSVIMGYTDLAKELVLPVSPVRKHLDNIKQAGQRAAALTKQLLAFSRQQVVILQVLNLNAVVHNASKMLQRLIGEDVSLVLRLGEPLGSVKADLGQMEQILMNLAVNARDAMPGAGKIVIETANVELDETYVGQHSPVRPGSYVLLSVSDTGCGMDAKTMAQIFEPFFTTKEPGKGTGLGLSTVYGIVKQNSGYVWPYSEVGRGTTFKVYFPRVDGIPERLKPERSDIAISRGTETILLVEDDNLLRELTVELLRSGGYHVLEARDANAALDIAKEHGSSLDLVLTDVIMPGMSGADLVAHLRASHPNVAILFTSGYAGDLVTRAGVPDAETLVIHKPYTRKDLLTRIRATFDERASK
ncbi:MAG TPA: response regulator [Candidatus Sulfotelmatobacter sp.]|nr:response regulator [Candidatus Sulfotelmatobacter sp.]